MTKQEASVEVARLEHDREALIRAETCLYLNKVRQTKLNILELMLKVELSACEAKEEEEEIVQKYNVEKEKIDKEYQTESLEVFCKNSDSDELKKS